MTQVGNVHASTMPERTRARFWAKVAKGSPDDCWLWTGNRSHNGYGRFSFNTPGPKVYKIRAHRAAWELVNDSAIPAGLTIDHMCRIRLCCNPAHMEVVGASDNVRRALGLNTLTALLDAAEAECEHLRRALAECMEPDADAPAIAAAALSPEKVA